MPAIKKPNQHFDATTYSGSGGTQSITNAGSFQPDLVWIKNRTSGYSHLLYNSISGAGTAGTNKAMQPDTTNGESAVNAGSTYGYLSAFNSNGFTVVQGSDAVSYTNASGQTYVAWNWKAGGTAVTNTAGSVTSQVSVNTTAGFSVVTYNTGSSGTQTFGHGLGVTPAMIIIKSRVSNASHWDLWHKSFSNPAQGYMYLNLDNALANDSRNWANAAPNSSVITYESGYEFTANQNYVAYCWAEIEGYSKFGSYAGNSSSDGPFLYCGFKPKFFIMKKYTNNDSTVAHWQLFDGARDSLNPNTTEISPCTEAIEVTSGAGSFDFLSNGVKVRSSDTYTNKTGESYIYIAFADNPFKYAAAN